MRKSPVNLQAHPWKVLLKRVRRNLLHYSVPTAVTYDGFDIGDSERRTTGDGQRIWASYGVGVTNNRPWWEAQFTDSAIIVRCADGSTQTLLYADLCGLQLGPLKKTETPETVILDGLTFLYTKSILEGCGGAEYEVLGAVGTDGRYRDIFLWHSVVVGAHIDRERNKRESEQS